MDPLRTPPEYESTHTAVRAETWGWFLWLLPANPPSAQQVSSGFGFKLPMESVGSYGYVPEWSRSNRRINVAGRLSLPLALALASHLFADTPCKSGVPRLTTPAAAGDGQERTFKHYHERLPQRQGEGLRRVLKILCRARP
jgi:hypothetical protein